MYGAGGEIPSVLCGRANSLRDCRANIRHSNGDPAAGVVPVGGPATGIRNAARKSAGNGVKAGNLPASHQCVQQFSGMAQQAPAGAQRQLVHGEAAHAMAYIVIGHALVDRRVVRIQEDLHHNNRE